ncbi:ABC transporter ATP-binding protein [Desulfoferula mesophila]|uniref:ABC transporter ATP-binding protein n=1 Tax=Desulfoferula mesophila TaxID=3058419 RepID=A0AAU9EJ24_9BACT|nr:ABC transporter ATP-binding protein [Desulfoferula mesophilus]
MPSPEPQDGGVVYCLRQVVKQRAKGGSAFELCVPRLDIGRGEFVAIVGASGCGKSTLLDLLGLVLSPSRCEEFSLRAGGQTHDLMRQNEASLARLRRVHLGYVLQTGGLLPFLSVGDNARLPCRLNGQAGGRDRVEELLAILEIEKQARKKPQFLSGGQRQRAAIARALAHRPPVVLADEPTAAVDKFTATKIRDQFKRLTREMGTTLIMVTHDHELVRGSADRTYTFLVEPLDDTLTRSTLLEAA